MTEPALGLHVLRYYDRFRLTTGPNRVKDLDLNIIVTLYKGVVETSLKSMWHSHEFNGRSETKKDVTSHNVTLHRYLAGSTGPQSKWSVSEDR